MCAHELTLAVEQKRKGSNSDQGFEKPLPVKLSKMPPMPALTLTRSISPARPTDRRARLSSGIRPDPKSFGSFRNITDVKSILPDDLYKAIHEEIPDNLDIGTLITFDNKEKKQYLNHAAFGRPYDSVLDLSLKLRRFAESNSDVFYDQACLPLINNTYKVLEDFLGTKQIVLVPNCTLGIRAVLEHLTKEKGHRALALLQPLYGSTQKLVESYRVVGDVDR